MSSGFDDLIRLLDLDPDCYSVVGDSQEIMRMAAERIARLEEITENVLEIFGPRCEKHTGDNTPPLGEFIEKYAGRCSICDVEKIAQLENPWVSVDERLPELLDSDSSIQRSEKILILDGEYTVGYYYSDGSFSDVDCCYDMPKTTHWAPLPEPPK